MRPLSKVAPDWWDYTTLDREILDDAPHLTAKMRFLETGRWLYVQVYVMVDEHGQAMTVEELDHWRQEISSAFAGERAELGLDIIFTRDEQWYLGTSGIDQSADES